MSVQVFLTSGLDWTLCGRLLTWGFSSWATQLSVTNKDGVAQDEGRINSNWVHVRYKCLLLLLNGTSSLLPTLHSTFLPNFPSVWPHVLPFCAAPVLPPCRRRVVNGRVLRGCDVVPTVVCWHCRCGSFCLPACCFTPFGPGQPAGWLAGWPTD